MNDTQIELSEISAKTIAHYQQAAESFRRGTADHDVSQNLDALCSRLEGPDPRVVLDLGCGPGRDLAQLLARGIQAVGLDGCAAFCSMAREQTGCEVLQQDFLSLALPSQRFDGIFANASLFHVPREALPRVLAELRASLKLRGVLFSSNPRGDDQQGWSNGRYGCFHSLEGWRAFMQAAGFEELDHYYRPAGRPRAEQPWLASVWRRASSSARGTADMPW